NLQAVYDFQDLITFLPERFGLVAHAGPGVSMTRPLGNYVNNTYNYPNLMGGMELHYRVSKSLSIFVDGSYVYSLAGTNKYSVSDGFSFKGDLMYAAIGLSLS